MTFRTFYNRCPRCGYKKPAGDKFCSACEEYVVDLEERIAIRLIDGADTGDTEEEAEEKALEELKIWFEDLAT